MTSNLAAKTASGKQLFDDKAIETARLLSDDIKTILEDYGTHPDDPRAVVALSRLLAQAIRCRPAHVSRLGRWRELLKILTAAEFVDRNRDIFEGCDEIEKILSLAPSMWALDEFLAEMLAEGSGQPMVRGSLGWGLLQ
jgi:hypothetical protein